ncbi:MAG TPA: hypothetical protein DCL66_04410, partial [Gammaproteobacteria bacterium]|nr:hypothetical protein [Gammaproteobacteria bacterium]
IHSCFGFSTNCSAIFSSPETGVTEIIWDSYGVLHVYGADEASTFYELAGLRLIVRGFFSAGKVYSGELWNSVDIVTAKADWSSVSDILKGR